MAADRNLAVITGASSGIGYELAKICADDGFDLVVAADDAKINEAGEDFRVLGATVTAVQADLATLEGIDKLYESIKKVGQPVDALLANAGRGVGNAFFDQNFDDVRHVINTNITGTV